MRVEADSAVRVGTAQRFNSRNIPFHDLEVLSKSVEGLPAHDWTFEGLRKITHLAENKQAVTESAEDKEDTVGEGGTEKETGG